ncbi:MAG: ABC transporter ATP-binding protein [Oscillospiraceae bacterium]|nr:ABC transporter ATP-binding protein [Oscillospiraceae bacterium]
MTAQTVISMRGICKSFFLGRGEELKVLRDIDLDIDRGEFVAIVGASGSGKSTLMNIIGALDRPTSGQYRLGGEDIEKLGDKELSRIRNEHIGFVFQNFNLISRTSALKNVALPMLYAGKTRAEALRAAEKLLRLVDMGDRMDHQPNELSGGQKQRVAIARSMINDPSIILADEPTGALDSATGRLIMDLFHRLHEQQGKTIVFITHSTALAEECGRRITLMDGRIISDERKCAPHAAV